MTEIIVAGYPKSGNTWLSRLLGDLYDCPVTGIGTAKPLAAEGEDRLCTSHIVRQLHLKPTHTWKDDRPSSEWRSAVDNAWWFAEDLWDPSTHKIVHIARDPRDVAVSVQHYWKRDHLWEAIDAMLRGLHPLKTHGPWHGFIERWLPVANVPTVRYEALSADPVGVLKALAWRLKLEPVHNTSAVVRRQSFRATRERIEKEGDSLPYGKEIQLHNLRKGIVGDWRNHWTANMGDYVSSAWGDHLLDFGWERDPNWWEKLRWTT